jgi:hypothetical protein
MRIFPFLNADKPEGVMLTEVRRRDRLLLIKEAKFVK